MTRSMLPALAAALFLSCSSGDAPPAALDTRNDACRFCRMPVSNPLLAAQLAAPGEEALFFDDIGCLRDYLRDSSPEASAVAYVADYRTGDWVRAARAVYDLCPAIETPMSSHLLAHADAAPRGEDASMKDCSLKSAKEVFGTEPPDGRKRGV